MAYLEAKLNRFMIIILATNFGAIAWPKSLKISKTQGPFKIDPGTLNGVVYTLKTLNELELGSKRLSFSFWLLDILKPFKTTSQKWMNLPLRTTYFTCSMAKLNRIFFLSELG